ncbi:DUF2235 domain-containing protein [Dyella sp.]|uniref:DUF2235 domain-containing protein n=1 Tax=Dyella sp. TaxID=1869338 RepID=UPI002ED64C66
MKRIAVFLDGTWNTVDSNTNVWRLKSLCSTLDDQLSYYSAGVGTQNGQRLIGGMFGYGLDNEVIQAYMWLMENYVEGDHIFLFGFSRGAFTARSLSGLISKCGLLQPGAPVSIPQLYARYKRGSAVPTIRGLKHVPPAQQTQEDKLLLRYSMAIPIWFQGVWDTVGALGVPFGHIPIISRSDYGFLETDLRINNDRAYHAMAIDEHRKAFAPTLWTRTIDKNAPADSPKPRPLDQVEQRWFVGAHADVGGGYDDGMLSQLPLNWLMQKARLHGLTFKSSISLDGSEIDSPIHDSFAEMAHGLYKLSKLGQPYYRPLGAPPVIAGDRQTTVINETIDASVFKRWRDIADYRPANLQAWATAHGVDCAKLDKTVSASDPAVPLPPEPQITSKPPPAPLTPSQ